MPPGAGSALRVACAIPSWSSSWLNWIAPGPLPTTTTGYSPGGNGRSSTLPFAVARGMRLPGVLVGDAQAPSHGHEHAVHDGRVLVEEVVEAGAGQDEATQRG